MAPRRLIGSGVALLWAHAALAQSITPSVAISLPMRLDILILAALSTLILWRASRFENGTNGRWTLALWALSGGLLGAAFVTPWASVPWLLVPVAAFALVAWRLTGGVRRRGLALATFFLAAALNLTAISVTSARGLRISPDQLAGRDLRVSHLLADVPVHDAWVNPLEGHLSATIEDVVEVSRTFAPWQSTPAMLALGALRGVLGTTFGWDDPRWRDSQPSFLERLTDDDRSRSGTDPGTRIGEWTLLYAFPREAVVELINGTAHVAVGCALIEEPEGLVMILSFHVREVNWSTRFYLGLIDPFRRQLLYPLILRQFAHAWSRWEG